MSEKKIVLPNFHITGGKGWINDPNGLCVFGRKYHVFYQYNPNGTKWGLMHWGHAASYDLCKWETLPVALVPGEEYDAAGCFSGSAIVFKDRLWLMYTGVSGSGEEQKQVQCLASSMDGVEFEKHGVVIGTNKLPAGYSASEFRDPKVWRHNGKFWCLIAAKSTRGRMLLYRSQDLLEWEFVNDIFGEDCRGAMYECPDYREDMGLFMCSLQNHELGAPHRNLHTTVWGNGKLDYVNGALKLSSLGIVDYGFDFYAPQTFLDTPVMIGWMNMWERTNPSTRYGFAGMLTVPRRIEVVNGVLRQTPIIKIKEKFTQRVARSFMDKIITGALRITARNITAFKLKMRKKDESCTQFKLLNGEWIFDRSRSGTKVLGAETDGDSLAFIRRMPFEKVRETKIFIIIDMFSVEIFVNGLSLSSTIYPRENAADLSLEVTADDCMYTRYEII